MVKFERGQFVPHNLEGNRQINDAKSDLFIYAPADYQERGLREQVVVAKPNGYPNQIFIGPIDDVFTIAKGFDLLDSLGYQELRKISVQVNFEAHFDGHHDWSDGKPFDDELLKAFGVMENLRDSKRSIQSIQMALQHAGVFANIRYPHFVSYDYQMYRETSPLVASFCFASEAIHEWIHHIQGMNELPFRSLWG